jgi:hypothetical protein
MPAYHSSLAFTNEDANSTTLTLLTTVLRIERIMVIS